MTSLLAPHSKKKVTYFYDDDISDFHYGRDHPMKPRRLEMTHRLIKQYGLLDKMVVIKPDKATEDDMIKFHDEKYIQFLSTVKQQQEDENDERSKFGLDDSKGNCPVFKGLFDFCQLSAGGSLHSAKVLNRKSISLGKILWSMDKPISLARELNEFSSDIVINWSGGLHHAHKSEASGFCYVNDVVLAIDELLEVHKRVLYIDIDIHHGDGVEKAYKDDDRVMTVSFHKYDRDLKPLAKSFFPGTGQLTDIGEKKGKNYCVNVPLRDGIDDEIFGDLFSTIVYRVIERFVPCAVVLQCGADSLAGDDIGTWNLTIRGHGACIELLKKANLPLMLLGGGGYTPANVAKCWTYETAVALDEDLPDELPPNLFYDDYGPDFRLHSLHSSRTYPNVDNAKYVSNIKSQLLKNLDELTHCPSVQPITKYEVRKRVLQLGYVYDNPAI